MDMFGSPACRNGPLTAAEARDYADVPRSRKTNLMDSFMAMARFSAWTGWPSRENGCDQGHPAIQDDFIPPARSTIRLCKYPG
jgi:hypothetical protein